MRQYEVAFIAHPELDEEGVTTLTEKVQGWITTPGGTVEKIDRWGKKRLAYEIRKLRDGHYVLIYATMNASGPAEVERNLRLNEQFLRFMITRTDEGAAPLPAATEAPAAAEPQPEQAATTGTE
jgi:small subunit ribosomal protein S6